MMSSNLINILMFYVRMQIDRLVCSTDLEMSSILKKGKLYVTLSFWQILIIAQLLERAKLFYNIYLMTRKCSYSSARKE